MNGMMSLQYQLSYCTCYCCSSKEIPAASKHSANSSILVLVKHPHPEVSEALCQMRHARSPLHSVAPVLFVVRPRVQLVQLVLPATAAMVPLEQALQMVVLVQEGTKPGLQHTQSLVPKKAEGCRLQDWQPRLHPIVVRVLLRTVSPAGVQADGTAAGNTCISACSSLCVAL
jgi:hypothetical protein